MWPILIAGGVAIYFVMAPKQQAPAIAASPPQPAPGLVNVLPSPSTSGVGNNQTNLPITSYNTIPAASVTETAYQTATLNWDPSYAIDTGVDTSSDDTWTPAITDCALSASVCYQAHSYNGYTYYSYTPCDGPYDARSCNGLMVEE